MVIQPFDGRLGRIELCRLRQQKPLVHCMTNEVVPGFTANVLLAMGASPAMVVAVAEAGHFASMADALLINVGTLYPGRDMAMMGAVDAANQFHKPWVLDPVAVGVLAYRSDFCQQLLAKHPTAIRGNASEIIALSGGTANNRGVESGNSAESALQSAYRLAKNTGAVIVATGLVDYITNGEITYSVEGGHAVMTKVVGTGCALSALVSALLAGADYPIKAVATACMVFAQAGKKAASMSHGPGSFVPAFLDTLYTMDTL